MAEKEKKVIDIEEARELGEEIEVTEKEGILKRAWKNTKGFVGAHWKTGLLIAGAALAGAGAAIMMNNSNDDDFEFEELPEISDPELVDYISTETKSDDNEADVAE